MFLKSHNNIACLIWTLWDHQLFSSHESLVFGTLLIIVFMCLLNGLIMMPSLALQAGALPQPLFSLTPSHWLEWIESLTPSSCSGDANCVSNASYFPRVGQCSAMMSQLQERLHYVCFELLMLSNPMVK